VFFIEFKFVGRVFNFEHKPSIGIDGIEIIDEAFFDIEDVQEVFIGHEGRNLLLQ